MSISNLLKDILNIQKKIDVKKLPSLGLFYKDDFNLRIKKATMEDIVEYEFKFKKDLNVILRKIKNIVRNNVILNSPYKFEDIKSIDIVFIFFEIVKFTNGKDISIPYISMTGENKLVNLSTDTFNYFNIDNYIKYYDEVERCFNIHGFKYSLPSIGIENSITNFFVEKAKEKDYEKYNHYSYQFLYFLGNRNHLEISEIDNLITIFEEDVPKKDLEKISEIISIFSDIGKYKLNVDGEIVDINSKINLGKIWN